MSWYWAILIYLAGAWSGVFLMALLAASKLGSVSSPEHHSPANGTDPRP